MTEQITPAELEGMTPDQINTARRAGQLDQILKGTGWDKTGPTIRQLTMSELSRLTVQQIDAAGSAGMLDTLLGINTPSPDENARAGVMAWLQAASEA